MKVLRVLSVSPTFHKLDLGGAETQLEPHPFPHIPSSHTLPRVRSLPPGLGSFPPSPAHPRALT